jgi:hypothetical protein
VSGDDKPCTTHEWREVPGEVGQYLCIACCTTGYRSKYGGSIVPHKKGNKFYRDPITAAPADDTEPIWSGGPQYGGRWVPPKPGQP